MTSNYVDYIIHTTANSPYNVRSLRGLTYGGECGIDPATSRKSNALANMRDIILWVKLLMLYSGNWTPPFILGHLLKNSVCMFNDSCSRLLLTTVWSSMWSKIWSSLWSNAVWKQYSTHADCFDSTTDLAVAIVPLSTDCGFKVIEDKR